MILALSKGCPHCGSCITAIGCDNVIECGICNFVQAAVTLSDAIIGRAIQFDWLKVLIGSKPY
jgi:hypothetical protein